MTFLDTVTPLYTLAALALQGSLGRQVVSLGGAQMVDRSDWVEEEPLGSVPTSMQVFDEKEEEEWEDDDWDDEDDDEEFEGEDLEEEEWEEWEGGDDDVGDRLPSRPG